MAESPLVHLHSNGCHVFHANHGSLVQLSESRVTAFRQRPSHEFNHGLVFSNKPLKDDQVFQVRIDRKVIGLDYFSCWWKDNVFFFFIVMKGSFLDGEPSDWGDDA